MNLKSLDDVKYKIHKIKVLNDNDKKAKAILKKAAEQVMPIMRKRRFSVELLSEFLPDNPNLLGLNIAKNSEIKIRLRNKKGGEIFHFNDIIGTLLHELAHIVHSSHNKSFYKLLDKLILEYNELYIYKNLGYTGKKVGDNKKKNTVFNSNPKIMAAQAAEKRLINNFIDKNGKMINLTLESCLTEQQRENLFKNRKEYDDKVCSLDNDVIMIDPLNNFYKSTENENAINYMHSKNNQNSTNSLNIKQSANYTNSKCKNKNYSNSKININYINTESNNSNFLNIKNNKRNYANLENNNKNFRISVNTKNCEETYVKIPKAVTYTSNNHGDDSVYILKVKKVERDLNEIRNENNYNSCDNFYINKNKKKKIIILD